LFFISLKIICLGHVCMSCSGSRSSSHYTAPLGNQNSHRCLIDRVSLTIWLDHRDQA